MKRKREPLTNGASLIHIEASSSQSMEVRKTTTKIFCDSQLCTKESLEILNQIDTHVNPCDDFYAFACNNLPDNVQYPTRYGPLGTLIEKSKIQLQKLYTDPISNEDHNMVKIQKKLFQACMNESAIEKNAYKTILTAIKAIGGWPVIEGAKWNESNFDWIQSTYKLRQLGYSYTTFLELTITADPNGNDRYIFKLSIPEVKDVYSKFFNTDETNGFMADVAVAFGAEVHHALNEMTQVLELLLDLQLVQSNHERADFGRVYRSSITEIQQRHGIINWLEYVNTIVGPKSQISTADYILFPSERAIDSWFSILFKASKRLQANYIIWRLVEDNLTFLTHKLQGKVKPKLKLDSKEETRFNYCIEEVRKRFSPSPLDIMYLRKYLPKEKKNKVSELLRNFKSAFQNIVKQIDWMNAKDREITEEKIDEVSIIVGAPGDYFQDTFLDNMNNYYVDTASNNNFLNMLVQANRNHETWRFSLIHELVSVTELLWWKVSSTLPGYDSDKNEIEVPASILQSNIFNENRPNYLNYGIMGVIMKNFFYGLFEPTREWINGTEESFFKKMACFKRHVLSKTSPLPNYLISQPLSHILGTKVSYWAYKDWTKHNGEEEPLYALQYTADQIFWISSGSIFCHYSNPVYNNNLKNETIRENYAKMISTMINNNAQLLNDFECPLDGKINFQEKCKLF